MLVKGIKITYYMKNGQALIDDDFQFNPIDENDKDFEDTLEQIKNLIKQALKMNCAGHVVIGTLFVKPSEIQAIKYKLIFEQTEEDKEKYKDQLKRTQKMFKELREKN